MFNINFKDIIFLIIILLLSFIFFIQLDKNDKQSKNISQLEYANQKFLSEIDELGREITKQQTLQFESSKQLKYLIDSVENLNIKIKTPKSFVKKTSNTAIKDTFIKYDTLVFVNEQHDTLLLNCVNFQDAWAKLQYCDVDSGSLIKEISFKDTISIIIHKKGLFKKKYETLVINTNPYNQTTGLNSVIVEDKKKLHTILKSIGGLGVLTLLILL